MSRVDLECCHCKIIFSRYASQVRNPKNVFCSSDCKVKYQTITGSGPANPNYKHGKHCEPSVCICGGEKDYRAKQCNRCKSNIDTYFKENSPNRNAILWRYIRRYDLLPYTNCLFCGIGWEWNNQPITLQLDHIDGNRHNNSLTNLRVLCPNCHSQTPTHCSRNKGRYK